MRCTHVILAMLITTFYVFSETTVAQLASSYVEPQETFTIEKIVVGGENYWIITINGHETFVVDKNIEIIRDKTTLEKLFLEQMRERVKIEQKRAEIVEYIETFNKSQYPERTECERITGVDKMPCYDKESCIKACYAVPFCSMQIRENLVSTIQEWNAQRIAVDEAIGKAREKAQNLNTQQDYEEMVRLINNMISAMKVLEANHIYTIPYCKNMNVDYDIADAAKANANEIAVALSGINNIIARTNSIYAKMNERLTYWENREKMYRQVYDEVVGRYSEVKSLYNRAGFVDGEMQRLLDEAANYSKIISSLKDEGKYRVAIEQGTAYKTMLSNLKISIQTASVQYENMKSKAMIALENIERAKGTLNSTVYMANLTVFENEINGVLSRKVNKSEIENLSSRMDEIDNAVKNMVANAVLEGAVNKNENVSTPSPLCSILNVIKSFVGFSVDFFGICRGD